MPPRLASKVGRAGRQRTKSAGATRRKSGPTSSEIVAATFANVELRFTKASMAEYSKRCEGMSRANELLRHQLEEHESDSIKVVQHLKEKLQCAEKEVTEQRGEIERLLAESADAEEDLRCQYERILEERDEQIVQYATTVQRLQSDLKGAAQHVHKREMHQLELKRLNDEIEEMRTRHDCELAALRFQTVDRKMRLVALEETMRERFQAQVEKESERLLEAKSKALLEDHESLQYERVRLTQDLEELVQLATVKNMECADVRRKGELHQRACEEAMRRIVLGNRRARDSEAKTQRLERRVKELMQEKNAMREELSRRYETQIQELEKTLAETQNSLQCHRAELQRLRRIASTIVDQRSDLERFFYVALDDVRRMRSKAPRRQQVASPVQLPSLLAAENNGNVAYNGANPRHAQQQHQHQAPPLVLEALPSSLVTKGGPTFLTESPASAKGINTPAASTVNTVPSSIPAPSPTGPSPSVPLPSPPPGMAPGRRGGGSARLTRDAAGHSNNKNNVLFINFGENGEGAYLNDLSWEDKEKIIKALLFFINQTCYQKLPGSQLANSEATLMET
ncbi:hypothetical protein MOQ_001242 [Trypanosoma cruzi marinkellei]|uniref:Basal body-orientation factor 1 n=1 Tax=Trypanosoma cruzi marinkellei TaxID=85056 RepID=K2NGQ4_TRYCR|nr:hypothetical protein MOQ_001242 [Trypanosoma cruzi marinkellei]